jgi:hypothetical protein
LNRAAVELREQLLDGMGVGRPAEGQRPGHSGPRLGAGGDQQRVVLDRLVGRPSLLPRAIDSDERTRRERCARGRRELPEVEVLRLPEPERLSHGHRAVPELRLGSE